VRLGDTVVAHPIQPAPGGSGRSCGDGGIDMIGGEAVADRRAARRRESESDDGSIDGHGDVRARLTSTMATRGSPATTGMSVTAIKVRSSPWRTR
jgi:hypothetical protein